MFGHGIVNDDIVNDGLVNDATVLLHEVTHVPAVLRDLGGETSDYEYSQEDARRLRAGIAFLNAQTYTWFVIGRCTAVSNFPIRVPGWGDF